MKQLLSLVLVFALLTLTTGSTLRAQRPAQKSEAVSSDKISLTNADVLEMIKAGLSTEIIVAKIRTSPAKFDTSPATLTDLKAAGVSDQVLMAMVHSTAAVPSVIEAAVKVPDGTEIEIQLVNNMSGQEVKVGDLVDFTIVRAVQVDGVTIFERDASARARITTAKKSGRWGKAGKLEWAMQDIQAADGNRIPARFKKRELGDSKGGTVAVAAVASSLLVGPFALLWGLKKGRPAIIPAGNRYIVFTDGDMTAKGKVLTTAQQNQ